MDLWYIDVTFLAMPSRDLIKMIEYIYMHTCQVGKNKKREISLSASCQRGRFWVKPFREIYFVRQHSNSGWNFEHVQIFAPFNCLKFFIWCIIFYHWTWWIKQCLFIEKFNIIYSFNEKMVGRRWGPKRGIFPLLRREVCVQEGDGVKKRESLS